MTLDELLGRYPEAKKDKDGWRIKCPGHDGTTKNSLRLVETGGKILLHCFSGCTPETVLQAMGLSFADLTPPPPTPPAKYTYEDANGQPLMYVHRFPGKEFRQQAANGSWSVKDVPKVPYHLPEVLAAVAKGETIWVAEGEKDCDNLRRLGMVATCNAGGASKGKSKWLPEHAKWLHGAARVVVVADKDPPGRAHAQAVAASLNGTPKRVVEVPVGKDASDWIATGAKREDFEALAADTVDPGPSDDDAPPQLQLVQGGGETGLPFNVVPFLQKSLAGACKVLRDEKLRDTTGLAGLIEFNELSERVEVNRKPLTDIEIQVWRERVEVHVRGTDANRKQKLVMFGADTAREAFAIVANENRYHPVQEYLRGLKPTKPVIADLAKQAFHQTEPLAIALVRMFFVGAAARALRPGCKHDHFMVMIGDESLHKSQAVRALFDPWVSDSELDLNDPKRALSMLNKFWCHEIAELKSFKGKQGHAVKQFLSSATDNFIPFKGQGEVSKPRSCVFVGTSNDRNPHTDPTGNRRTHPIHIAKPIDLGMLRELRDAAWAEAVANLEAGERWWPSDEQAKLLRGVNEDLMIEDPWESKIAALLTGSSTTIREVLEGLKIEITDDHGSRHTAHVTAALRALEWSPDDNATREKGSRVRRWRPRHGVKGHECTTQCTGKDQ